MTIWTLKKLKSTKKAPCKLMKTLVLFFPLIILSACQTTPVLTEKERYSQVAEEQKNDPAFSDFINRHVLPYQNEKFIEHGSFEKFTNILKGQFKPICDEKGGVVSIKYPFIGAYDFLCVEPTNDYAYQFTLNSNWMTDKSLAISYAGMLSGISERFDNSYTSENYEDLIRFEGELILGETFSEYSLKKMGLDTSLLKMKFTRFEVISMEAITKAKDNKLRGALYKEIRAGKERAAALVSEIAAMTVIFNKKTILFENGFIYETLTDNKFYPLKITPEGQKDYVTHEHQYNILLKNKDGEELIYDMSSSNKLQLTFISKNTRIEPERLQAFVLRSNEIYEQEMWISVEKGLQKKLEKERRIEFQKQYRKALDAHRDVLVPNFQNQILCKIVPLNTTETGNSYANVIPAKLMGTMTRFSSEGYDVFVELNGWAFIAQVQSNIIDRQFNYRGENLRKGATFWDSIAGWETCR